MFTFDIAGDQIDGARDYQEDAFLTTQIGDSEEGGSLIIVADGMGGHAAGNVASNMAVQTFNKHVTSNFPNNNLSEILRQSVIQANASITETVRETAALKGMGCTLVACVLENDNLRWVSVGDSHLYLIRNGELSKKNADHSYGGFLDRMAAEGNPIEPEAGFSRNMLMSALTGDDIAEIDCPDAAFPLLEGDRIIVASDGLDTLSGGKILSYCKEASTAKKCVESLLKGVVEADMPRQDNTTVIVIDILEKPDTPTQFGVRAAVANVNDIADAAGVSPQDAVPQSRYTVESSAEKSSPIALIIGLGLVILLLVGGAAFFLLQSDVIPQRPAKVPDLMVESDEPLTEGIEDLDEELIVEDDTDIIADEEPAPPAEIETPVSSGETFQDKLKSGGKGPLMAQIPKGAFKMGSPESSAKFDERPAHRVALQAFAAGVYEVTVAQYEQYAKATGKKAPKSSAKNKASFPVVFITWNEALNYTKWLSKQTGKKYRLPTEAEWEYLARAGTTTRYWWARKIGAGNAHCFTCDTGLDPRNPTKVGRFKANAFGLYDTSGNVQEWVYDCFNKNYEGAPDDGSVFEGGDCTQRIVRGGSYGSGKNSLRSSARDKLRAKGRNDVVGFRVVRDN